MLKVMALNSKVITQYSLHLSLMVSDIILREIPVIVIPSIFVIIIIVELIRLIRKQSLQTG